jgi:hypothetical protein
VTAVATWSTHGLREDQARDASEGKLADLNMAWTLTFPPRDRVEWSVRYRKVDMLTVGELQSGRLAEFRPAFASFGVTPSSVLVGCRSQHIDRRIAGTSRQHGPYDGTAD